MASNRSIEDTKMDSSSSSFSRWPSFSYALNNSTQSTGMANTAKQQKNSARNVNELKEKPYAMPNGWRKSFTKGTLAVSHHSSSNQSALRKMQLRGNTSPTSSSSRKSVYINLGLCRSGNRLLPTRSRNGELPRLCPCRRRRSSSIVIVIMFRDDDLFVFWFYKERRSS